MSRARNIRRSLVGVVGVANNCDNWDSYVIYDVWIASVFHRPASANHKRDRVTGTLFANYTTVPFQIRLRFFKYRMRMKILTEIFFYGQGREKD